MRKRPFKVMVYFNEEEYNRLNELAEKTNLGKSNLVRYLLQGYEPMEAPPVDYRYLILELRRIGNNINQILYLARQNGFLNPRELKQHLNELHIIEDKMHKDFDFKSRRKSLQQLEKEIIKKKEGNK